MYRKLVAGLSILLLFPHSVRAIDPITVVSFGKGIADYFAAQQERKERAKELEVISEQLVQINGKLDSMNSKLDMVLEELRALNVHLDEALDREARTRVIAIVKTIGNDYPTWSKNPGKYVSQANNALQALEIESNNLMLRKNASNFETVAFAMLIEKDMLTLLDSDPDLIRTHFTAYEDYFKSVSNPTDVGSIGEAMQQATAKIDSLTATIAGGPYWCHSAGRSQTKRCCGDGVNCEYNYFSQSVGGVDRAFVLASEVVERQTGGPGPDGACRHHEPPIKPDTKPDRSYLPVPELLKPASYKLPLSGFFDVYGLPGSQMCPDQLNGMRSDRVDTVGKLAGLNQANETATKFAEIAHRLANPTAKR